MWEPLGIGVSRQTQELNPGLACSGCYPGSAPIPFTDQCPHFAPAGCRDCCLQRFTAALFSRKLLLPLQELHRGGNAVHSGDSPQPATDTGVQKSSTLASRWAHLCVHALELFVGSGGGQTLAEAASLLSSFLSCFLHSRSPESLINQICLTPHFRLTQSPVLLWPPGDSGPSPGQSVPSPYSLGPGALPGRSSPRSGGWWNRSGCGCASASSPL